MKIQYMTMMMIIDSNSDNSFKFYNFNGNLLMYIKK